MNRMLGEEEEEVELGGWGAGVQPDSAGRVGGEAQLFLHSTPTCIMHITKKNFRNQKKKQSTGGARDVMGEDAYSQSPIWMGRRCEHGLQEISSCICTYYYICMYVWTCAYAPGAEGVCSMRAMAHFFAF